MKHRVLIYQGKTRGTRCSTDTDGWRLTKEPRDPRIVATWRETTCSACHSTRIKPCKRGHKVGRMRFNSQGNPICMDCTNLAVFKYHQRRKAEREKVRVEFHMLPPGVKRSIP